MNHRCAIPCVLTILLFTLAGCYRHEKMGNTTVRTHRLTGKTERLTVSGWQEMEFKKPADLRELSQEELYKLTGTGDLTSYGSFVAVVYNGNEFPVTGIVFWVGRADADGNLIGEAKRYRAPESYTVGPLGTQEIIISDMDIYPTGLNRGYQWDFVSAQTPE